MWIAFIFFIFSVEATDPLSLVKDYQIRKRISDAQFAEINSRLSFGETDCSKLLADLPFSNNTKVPFHNSLSTIQDNTSQLRLMPKDCLNQLIQNLSLSNNPASIRVADELLSTDREREILSKTNYCAPAKSGIEEILGLSQNFKNIQDCAPLTQGEWKKVSGITRAHRPYDYSLIQIAPNHLKAVLNIQFQGSQDGITGEILLERSRRCLNSVEHALKGPKGEKLSISLLTPSELRAIPRRMRPKPSTISIVASNSRSHSVAYASSIDCPAIVHEVLHLFGLCDEYPGEKDNYPCRAVGAPDNIMRNQNQSFGVALAENLRCICKTDDCHIAMSDPIKRDLVLKPVFYDVISTEFRNQFCERSDFYQRPIDPNKPIPSAYSATLESRTVLKIITALDPSPTHYLEGKFTCRCPREDKECQQQLISFQNPSPQLKPLSCPAPTSFLSSTVGQAPLMDRYHNKVLEFHRPALKKVCLSLTTLIGSYLGLAYRMCLAMKSVPHLRMKQMLKLVKEFQIGAYKLTTGAINNKKKAPEREPSSKVS